MRALALLALLLALVMPTVASAHHSAAGGEDCGTLRADAVAEMVKGRTDGMVYAVDHQVGCKRLILRNLVGTGFGEAYDYPGQRANCVRWGQQDAANVYRYYFDTEIDPASVKVTCSRYSGPD